MSVISGHEQLAQSTRALEHELGDLLTLVTDGVNSIRTGINAGKDNASVAAAFKSRLERLVEV